jgi:hypothetical protein
MPRILMDEADAPYNRNTPYMRVNKDGLATPEEIKNSTYQWLVNYMVAQQLDPKTDFVFEGGQSFVRKGKLNKINLNPIDKQSCFEKGLNLIAEKYDLNDEEKRLFQEDFNHNLLEVKNLKHYKHSIANHIAEAHDFKNRHYVIDQKTGQPIVRDSYIDELLEEHQYNPELQLAILAVNDRFDLVDFNQTVDSAIKFPTFVSLMADKLCCFSGTLLYPDMKTGKTKSSTFAKLLEDITHRPVSFIAAPEENRHKIPSPDFFENQEKMQERLIADFKKKSQPTLIINYEEVENTSQLYQTLKLELSDKKIALLPPKPSSPAEEADFNKTISDYTRRLAEGEIDILISSGTAGIGVNIVKSDGSFPDLHVALLGMPESEIQPIQGIGRRRAPGDNFSWYIDTSLLSRHLSVIDNEPSSKLDSLLGKIDRKLIIDMIDERNSPEKRLDAVVEILRQMHWLTVNDDLITIQQDVFFKKVSGLFKDQIGKIYGEAAANVPESLSSEIAIEASLPPMTNNPQEFTSKLSEKIFNTPFFETKVLEWQNTIKKRTELVKEINFNDEEISFAPVGVMKLPEEYVPLLRPIDNFSLPISFPQKSYLLPVKDDAGNETQICVISVSIHDENQYFSLGTFKKVNDQAIFVDSVPYMGKPFTIAPMSGKSDRYIMFSKK